MRRVRISNFTKPQQQLIESELRKNHASDSVKYLFSNRLDDNSRQRFIYKHVADTFGSIQDVWDVKLEFLIGKFISNPSNNQLLEEVKLVYSKIKNYDERYYFYGGYYDRDLTKIPYENAKQIMSECKNYPRMLVSMAEKSCRIIANDHLIPVGEIAKNGRWFEDDDFKANFFF